MAKRSVALTKMDKLHFMLGKLGSGEITRAEFERMMQEQHLTDADIDEYCRAHFSGQLKLSNVAR